MTYREFVKQTIDVPDEERSPFCPFETGYCDVAFSDTCYSCNNSVKAYAAKYIPCDIPYREEYIPPACRHCSNHPSNGGTGICLCTLGQPYYIT